MLLVLLRLPRVLLVCFGIPVLSLPSWSYSVYYVVIFFVSFSFVLSHLRKGHDAPLIFYLFICLFILLFYLLFVSFVLSVIALSPLLNSLQCSISVSWF